ncbi:lysine-epsilon-oxidase maturase LodB [Paraflavitalea pollutisoli]|uniref:lysine-epsilon-oxidase maturase LodB n=1 Tax=Paraflavitalea pollutisoli TaxID=3034143 RepID=UPI0023EC6AFF|nr:lysine-epsilon-oxidase maturase LodB [Paraflavitalea sp. H1-2-19X]
MTEYTNDVLIIGGGPAGAAAALSLLQYGKDLDVSIVELTDFDFERIGEHVSLAIFDLIDYLQIDRKAFGPDCFLPSYGHTTYWGMDLPVMRDAVFTTAGNSYQLDRLQFDITLLEQVAARGGHVFPNMRCKQFLQDADGSWKVVVRHRDKGEFTFRTRFLVDATGRKASVCRQIGVPTEKTDKLLGVGARVVFKGRPALAQEVMLETVENGWWYSATLARDTRTMIFFSDADIISQQRLHTVDGWIDTMQQSKHLKELLQGAEKIDEVWLRSAHSQFAQLAGRTGFIAIGDAAVAFDPVSSMGVGFALTSACQAASVILGELAAPDPQRIKTYQSDLERHFYQYMDLRRRIYQQEKRWPESAFWQRRQAGLAEMVP